MACLCFGLGVVFGYGRCQDICVFCFMPDKIVGTWWSFHTPKTVLHNSHCSVVMLSYVSFDSRPANIHAYYA